MSRRSILEALRRIHADVDREVAPLTARHAARLQCRKGCSSCCVDGITVFEVEAENIREHHAELVDHGAPHPEGACAFLDETGACRIYEHRPYVCRTQGLPLRWIEEPEGALPLERRDICPLNEAGEPIETLPEEACWTLGAFEGKLALLQASIDAGALRRVSLRSIFTKG